MSLFLRLENLRGKYQDICNLLSNAAAKKKWREMDEWVSEWMGRWMGT